MEKGAINAVLLITCNTSHTSKRISFCQGLKSRLIRDDSLHQGFTIYTGKPEAQQRKCEWYYSCYRCGTEWLSNLPGVTQEVCCRGNSWTQLSRAHTHHGWLTGKRKQVSCRLIRTVVLKVRLYQGQMGDGSLNTCPVSYTLSLKHSPLATIRQRVLDLPHYRISYVQVRSRRWGWRRKDFSPHKTDSAEINACFCQQGTKTHVWY